MLIWYFCFIVGAAAALVGMGLGIAMGITQDFTLSPVHAHINLLGWVSMLLYGLYYRGVGEQVGRLAWVQVTAAALGFVSMTAGLALLLSGLTLAMAEPLVIAGSSITVGSMAAFMTILVRDAIRSHSSRRLTRQAARFPHGTDHG